VSGGALVVLVVISAGLAAALWPARSPSRTRSMVGRPRGAVRSGRAAEAATPHTVADALVLLALALRSGMGQREALECVARTCDGTVAGQLRTVSAALRWGRPSQEAWAYAPTVWRPAALAWHVSEATGSGPAQLVEDASWRIRDREDRRVEAAGARAAVRLVLPLGAAFLPSFACTSVIPVVLALGERVLGP
jgi:Flp pilus assembly protein TadB